MSEMFKAMDDHQAWFWLKDGYNLDKCQDCLVTIDVGNVFFTNYIFLKIKTNDIRNYLLSRRLVICHENLKIHILRA